MSELMNTRNTSLRRQLLTTASALALLFSISSAAQADDGHPTLWIELGGQIEDMSGQGEPFAPAFIAKNEGSLAFSPLTPIDAQKLPYSFGEEGAVTFQPKDSSWMFLASVRYGRSSGGTNVRQQTQGHRHKNVFYYYPTGKRTKYITPSNINFSQTDASHDQGHLIADFQAGKDVGLGMFGSHGSSVFGFGIRFAQFISKSLVEMHAAPDVKTFNAFSAHPSRVPPSYYVAFQKFHAYTAFSQSARSFHGIGPSISWNNSTPVMGNPQQSEIDIDWGTNAAVLFGRQRVSGSHQTTSNYRKQGVPYSPPQSHSAPFARTRTSTVPNVGGFAGVSFRYAAAKVSLGYRGDFFFGAMDTGIDTRKTGTVGFYGPFASISVGLGG